MPEILSKESLVAKHINVEMYKNIFVPKVRCADGTCLCTFARALCQCNVQCAYLCNKCRCACWCKKSNVHTARASHILHVQCIRDVRQRHICARAHFVQTCTKVRNCVPCTWHSEKCAMCDVQNDVNYAPCTCAKCVHVPNVRILPPLGLIFPS